MLKTVGLSWCRFRLNFNFPSFSLPGFGMIKRERDPPVACSRSRNLSL